MTNSPLHGIVVNFRHAMPTRSQINDLNPDVIRSIIYSDSDLDTALAIIPPHIKVIVLLSSEHEELGPDYVMWGEYVQRFASKYAGRVWAVEIENEADLKNIPPQVIASLLYFCEPLKDAGIIRIASSVAGPNWQQYLEELSRWVTRQYADGCSIHPYGQHIYTMGAPQPSFLPGLSPSISVASSLMGDLPCYVTEFGAKISDYGGEVRQAEYVTKSFEIIDDILPSVCPVACYFAWHDHVGAPYEQGEHAFGLMAADGRKRPAWYAFQNLQPPTYEYVLGFREIYERHPELIGRPLRNERGIVLGNSFQPTENGWLYWGMINGMDTKGFLVNDDERTTYIWNGAELVKV